MTITYPLHLNSPLLTAAEEIDLADRIEAGVIAGQLLTRHETEYHRSDLEALETRGREAWDRFFQSNLRLALFIARTESRRWGRPVEDIFQEACVGLAEAIMRWDHHRGVRFSTFAFPWIKEKANREAANGRHRGRPMTAVTVSPMLIAELDRGTPDPDPFADALPWWFDQLSQRQQTVLALRFGFGTNRHTIAQAAGKLGLSMGQVRRLEANALAASRRLLTVA